MSPEPKPSDSDRLSAVSGALALFSGTYLVIVSSVKLGLAPEPSLGLGLYVEAAIASGLMVVIVTIFAAIVGLVLARYIQWRYRHRRDYYAE